MIENRRAAFRCGRWSIVETPAPEGVILWGKSMNDAVCYFKTALRNPGYLPKWVDRMAREWRDFMGPPFVTKSLK